MCRSCSSGRSPIARWRPATASAPRPSSPRELGVSRPAVREAVRLLVQREPRAGGERSGRRRVRRPHPRWQPRADGQRRDRRHARDRHDLGCRADRGAPAARGAAGGTGGRARERSRPSPSCDAPSRRRNERRTTTRSRARPTSASIARSPRRAGNRVACALTAWSSEVLQSRLKDLIAPAIVEAVAREQHREILAAIEQRKPGAAERAMRDPPAVPQRSPRDRRPPAPRSPAGRPP